MLSPSHHHGDELPAGHPCRGCPVRDLAICGVLGTAELNQFRHLGCRLHLGSGETLFSQGDPTLSVYTVTEGTMKSYRLFSDGRRQVVGFHMAGDFVGASVDEIHAYSGACLGRRASLVPDRLWAIALATTARRSVTCRRMQTARFAPAVFDWFNVNQNRC